MARGMKFDPNPAEINRPAMGQDLRAAAKFLSIAQPHHVERLLGGQYRAMAGPRVVGMAVGDDGALDGAHRIYVEAAELAAKSGGVRHQDVLWAHRGYIRGLVRIFTRHARA